MIILQSQKCISRLGLFWKFKVLNENETILSSGGNYRLCPWINRKNNLITWRSIFDNVSTSTQMEETLFGWIRISLQSWWGWKWATRKAKAETGTSAGLGVGVQVRGIMGEKVLLLIAALELWPALWSTKDRSDMLQWLGLVNICPTSGMPRFPLTSPTKPQSWPLYSLHSQLFKLQFYSPWGGGGNVKTHTYMLGAY